MKPTLPKTAAAAAVSAGALAVGADRQNVQDLVDQIRNGDDEVRGNAWQNAGPAGAAAIGPLSDLLVHDDFEVARSAKRAMENIVRYAGRPGADAEARAVEQALVPLLGHFKTQVRRDALWMLSEIASDASVGAMARLLKDREVRDDARMTLQRVPGDMATMMLQTALNAAPEDFRYNLAEALRKRGVKVEGYPSQKLQPGLRP
ncbi:MAG: hypothetical protein H7A45_01775 [Verrucomicrobiales bacterium]|nr:hypothetical protein [Verrucomicrobiales bacterium]